MPSVSQCLRFAPAALVLTALPGCVTTQQRNARTVLINERTVASQTSVRVTRKNPYVAVTGVASVTASGTTAVAVQLRNRATHPLTDLPISIGVRAAGGRRLYLNGHPDADYFSTHIASIGPGETLTWVFTTRNARAHEGRLFAAVGIAKLPANTSQGTLPRITVAGGPPSPLGTSGHRLRVVVSNPSPTPQYQLQIYAASLTGGRYVGAGRVSVASLDGGARKTLDLTLVGSLAGAVRLFATPTIFN
ncbi:MAG: hypothetical protein QOD66_1733 [Solirubrobacteraceae bacterium]|nr:hypothetical protein [Solirubrobacteraceae bacterium]